MAISFVGSSTKNVASGTSIGVVAPTGLAAGHLLLAMVDVKGATETINTPTGWTQVNGTTINQSKTSVACFYKLAVAGDVGATLTFTYGTSAIATAVVVAYSGVDQANPIPSVGSSNGTTNTSGTWTDAGVTISNANDLLVSLIGIEDISSVTYTVPTGYTKRVTYGYNTSNYESILVADKTVTAAGASGTTTWDASANLAVNYAQFDLEIKQAVVDVTLPPTAIVSGESFGKATIGLISLRSTPTTGTDYVYRGTITANLPSGVVAGDLLIAALNATSGATPPSGWTKIAQTAVLGSAGTYVYGYYKVATASEPASYTFNDGSGGYGQVIIAAYANTSQSIDASTVVNLSNGGQNVASLVPGTVTTSLDNELVLVLGGTFTEAGTLSSSYWQFDAHLAYTGNTDIFIAEGQQSAAGTSSSTAITHSSVNVGNAALITVALTPFGVLGVLGLPSAEAFGTVGLQYDQSLNPAALATAESFGPITLADDIAPPTIASSETFGTSPVTASYAVNVSGDSIASAESFAPIYVESPNIDPAGIASAEAFGTFSLSFDQFIAPPVMGSGEALGSTALQYDQTLDATGEAIASAEFIGTLTVGQTQTVALRGAAAMGSTNGSNITFNAPTGLAAGDVLLAFISTYGNQTLTPPTGWTLLGHALDGSSNGHYAYYKVAGASEPTTYPFTGSGSYLVGSLIAYSGVDNNTPVNAWNKVAGTTNFSDSGITTTDDGCQLVAAMNDMAYATTFTPTTGWTARSARNDTGNNQSGIIADKTQATAGASGSFMFTAASPGDVDITWMVALQPGVAVGSFAIGPTQIASTEAFGSTSVAASNSIALSDPYALQSGNLVASPDDLTQASWTNANTAVAAYGFQAPDGSLTATHLTGTAASYWMSYVANNLTTQDYIIRAWVKSNTGSNQTFRLAIDNSGAARSPDLTATTSWQHFTYQTSGFTGTFAYSGIYQDAAQDAGDLLVWHFDVVPLSGFNAYAGSNAIQSAENFGSAALGTGAVANQSVTAPAIASAEAFGSTSLTWDQSLAPTGIASVEHFGSDTVVSNDTVDVTGHTIPTAEVFGTASIDAEAYITGPPLATAESFGSVHVIEDQFLAPAAIASSEAFGTAHLTLFLTPSAIASGEAFGSAGLAATASVAPASISSAESFGSAHLASGDSISPAGIASSESFGSASLATARSVTPTGLSAIRLVNTQKQAADNGSNASLTVTNPTDLAQGDLLLLSIFAANAAAPVTPSGWTLVQEANNSFYTATYYKIAGASEPATWTFTNGSTAIYDYLISAYRGVDQANPVHDVQSPVIGSSGSPAINSFTTSVAQGLVLAVTGLGALATYTAPSGWALDGNSRSDGEFNYGQQPSGTVVPASTFTSNAGGSWAAYAFTLQPAVAAAAPSAEWFGSASLSQSATAQSVTVSGIATAESFGPVTLSLSNSVTPTGMASGETFYNATIGTVGSIVPQPIGSAEAFGVAQIVTGGVSVSPTAITSGQAFGTAELDRSFSIPALPSGEAFGSASLTTSYAVAPSAAPTAEAFGTATLGTSINATGLASSESFGTAAVAAGAVSLSPASIASGQAFGVVQVSTNGSLSASAIASAENVPSPVMGFGLSVAGMASGETVAAPSLATSATVAPTGIASAEALAAPVVAFDVLASGIASGEAFGTALVANDLDPAAIASGEWFGTAIIGGINPINVNPQSDQTLVVQADPRTLLVATEARTVSVAAESRTVAVAAGTNLIY